ncbi:hypothetical protein QUB75_10785 [Microcoleus sp. K1-B6]|uniref:hypothetical protein n=1 Tax=unclassified Microcoleus TaxID=2642155 RepID=UPI002FD78818
MRFWQSGAGAREVLPVSAIAIGAGIMPDRQSNLLIRDFFKYKLVDRTQRTQTRQTKGGRMKNE